MAPACLQMNSAAAPTSKFSKVKSKLLPLVLAGCLAFGAPLDADAARKSGGRAGGSNFKKAPTQQSQSFSANQNSPDGRVSGFAAAGNKPATTSTAATAAPAAGSTTVVHHHHHGGGGMFGGFGSPFGMFSPFGMMGIGGMFGMGAMMGGMMSPFGYRPMMMGPSIGQFLIIGGVAFLIYKLFFSNRRDNYY